jgi:hypothetical protein
MYYITNLPESTASEYTGILVIVDHLTKMAIYLPFRKDIDYPQLAQMYIDHGICKRGLLDIINTDCGNQFTCRIWA